MKDVQHSEKRSRLQARRKRLPVELIERIVVEFIRLPDTNFEQLKGLRLVSKVFDEICAPRVLGCIRLFDLNQEDASANLNHLISLISPQRPNLTTTKTLVVNWQWTFAQRGFKIALRHWRKEGFLKLIALNTLVLPLIHLIAFVCEPKILPKALVNASVRLGARIRLWRATDLNIPTTRRVEWTISGGSTPTWIISRTVEWLMYMPQLTELALFMDEEQDFKPLARRLSKLRNLQKLTLSLCRPPSIFRGSAWSIHELGKVIAANPNLTHLELFRTGSGGHYREDVSALFRHVNPDRPMKLEHLGISANFKDVTAIRPHIRSLRSIHEKSLENVGIFTLLLNEQIFPPVIRTQCCLLDYINNHPGVISLSVDRHYGVYEGREILEALARHSGTLEHFSTVAKSLFYSLEETRCEMCLLQCTHLRHIVLRNIKSQHHSSAFGKMKSALTVIARLENLSTLVFTDLDSFEECMKHCREASNPLVRALGQRAVYEKMDAIDDKRHYLID